jgi:tRNA A-37 threonylcarbamoyl transferase component Bud32
MPSLAYSTPVGTVCVVAERERDLRPAAERALVAALQPRAHGGFVELSGERAYLKGSHLEGRARWRHALRALVLARPLPRVAERANLLWLRERLFLAPRPLAAGWLAQGRAPRYQFLYTEEVAGALGFEAFLAAAAERERAAVLDELAGELARMHALGFVHHDLYPRNLLVRDAREPGRVVFLDAWRGGPPPQLRGADYDLACFMLEGARLFSHAEQRRFFERYFAERAAQGRPAEPSRVLRRARAQRARLRARLVRRPRELRGAPPPPADWDALGLAP